MFNTDYYRSLSLELRALQNRVRSLIQENHWITDGEWKESVLRSMLRRNLPRTTEVGRGFILSPSGPSKQIDVLIYDTSKPVLFRDGDLVFVTPDAVRAVIEVKTKVDRTKLVEALRTLGDHGQLVRTRVSARPFIGLFSYETSIHESRRVLDALQEAANGVTDRIINCVCLGQDLLARHWNRKPDTGWPTPDMWRSYKLDRQAPGYFLHNLIESISPQSVGDNSSLWYPTEGKEQRCEAELLFNKSSSDDALPG